PVRAPDPPFADLLAINVQADGSPLTEATAVVGELHPHLVLACGQWRGCSDVVVQYADGVVAVLQLALMRVEAPAAHVAALGDNDAAGSRRRHLDLRRDRM